MPSSTLGPRPAYAARLDARPWSGTAVFNRGGTDTVLDTYADGEGVWDDPLAFLDGYGSQAGVDLTADVQALWTAAGAAGTVTITISASGDFITVTSDTVDFSIPAHADNAVWGASTSGHGLVGGSAPYVRTFSNPWQRGVIQNKRFRITPSGSSTLIAPSFDCWSQSVVTLIRTSSESDADDGVAACLETLDNDINDNADRRIRWGIDGDGYVYTTRPSGVGAAVTFLDDGFMQRLGFTGDEVEVADGNLYILTATHRLPGFWVPRRPIRRLESWHTENTVTVGLRSGGVVSNNISRWTGWTVSQWAGGQVDSQDDEAHLRDRFFPYALVGHPLTVFPEWGEPRRQLAPWQVGGTQAAYDLTYTSQKRRGRLRCLRDPDDSQQRAFSHEGSLYLRAPLEFRLRDRGDG